jgi:thiamine biosynthesis lipoprotein
MLMTRVILAGRLFVVVAAAALLGSCAAREYPDARGAGAVPLRAGAAEPAATPQRFEYSKLAMGARARIVVYAPDEPTARDAASAAFARIEALEQVMSDYRADSELSRLNAAPPGEPVEVSEELWTILETARRTWERTNGAFDPAAGELSLLWREARRTGVLPSDEALAAARARSGMGKVKLIDERRGRRRLLVRVEPPGVRFDLGGIGKGLAAEEAVRVLRERGTPVCLVALGGDIAAGSPPTGKPGWVVSVETGLEADATADDGDDVLLLGEGMNASTSGDVEQFAKMGGVRYSHIFDARTGRALTTRRAATVVGTDGAAVDAWATALSVIGSERADAWQMMGAAELPAARLVERDALGVDRVFTSRLWSVLARRADGGPRAPGN